MKIVILTPANVMKIVILTPVAALASLQSASKQAL
jgi:hypothetical protein